MPFGPLILVLAKVVNFTTTTDNRSGTGSIKLYFTEYENVTVILLLGGDKGFSLRLMLDLPFGDKEQTENNVIYLDESSRKCILRGLDGNVHELEVPKEINLSELANKLEDNGVKEAILEFTSNRGCTLFSPEIRKIWRFLSTQ